MEKPWIKIIEMSNGFLCFFIDILYLDSFALGLLALQRNKIPIANIFWWVRHRILGTLITLYDLSRFYTILHICKVAHPSYLPEIKHAPVAAHTVLFLETEGSFYAIDGPRCWKHFTDLCKPTTELLCCLLFCCCLF